MEELEILKIIMGYIIPFILGGTIGFISPVAEFTPKTVETTNLRTDLVYQIRVYIDNDDGFLRQGMPLTIIIDTKH